MSIASAIEELIAEGFTPAQAIKAAKIVEANLASRGPSAEVRKERNARYYQARKERLKASEIKTPKTSEKTESLDVLNVLKASESVLIKTPLARVDDNLLPLEIAGKFQEEGVSQVSKETFETLVPAPKIKTRKQNVDLFQTIVGMWNEMAARSGLVAVRDITTTRQAAILARSQDFLKTYDFPDAIDGWRKLMGLVRGSPFLRGELNGFRCDFDFATRASSFTKIMEGKYEARQAAKRR